MSLVAILSPAKKLADTQNQHTPNSYHVTTPLLWQKTQELIKILKALSCDEIQALMHLSTKLATLNYDRFQSFSDNPTDNAIPALFAFKGDTYIGLNAHLLDDNALNTANNSVLILSGLYGILRASDMIQPYRLEMGTALANPKGRKLYDFWYDVIAKTLMTFCQENNKTHIINLASHEYFDSIDKNYITLPIIKCDFKQMKNGDLKPLGMMTKRYRGMMAHYIIKQSAKTIDDLKNFHADGFCYHAEHSTDDYLLFVK